MRKILKNFCKKDILYAILSVANMYILPYILYLMFFKKLMGSLAYGGPIEDFCDFCFLMSGCIMQFVLTALYERRKSEKNNTALWLTVLLSVPLAVEMIIYFVEEDTLMNELILISSVAAAPVCAAAGMWFGRFISGKYKGEKRFYAADKIFIGISVLLAAFYCLNIYFNNPPESYNDENFSYIILIFGIVCVLYSRFSEFEYLAEKLVRAMVTGFIAFMPCGFLYRILLEMSNLSHYSYYYAEDVLFAAPLAAAAAFIGVMTGYYLRIMKHGGDDTVKKIPFIKRVKTVLTAAVVLGALIGGIKLYADNKYWLCKTDTNLWELTGANEDDIYLMRLELDSANDQEVHLTVDKKAINDIVSVMKKENGARNVRPYNSPWDDGYGLTAYDKNGVKIFAANVSRYGIDTVYVHFYGEKRKEECEELFIPAQYYQKEPTKYGEYLEPIKAGEMSAEEKIAFMHREAKHLADCMDAFWGAGYDYPTDKNGNRLTSEDLYCITDFCEDFASDKNSSVRKAFAETLDEYREQYDRYFDISFYLFGMLKDKDAGVRAAAYRAYGNIEENGTDAPLFNAILTEDDIKARFFAVTAWANAVKNNENENSGIPGGAYIDPAEWIKNRYNGENTDDTEKLACACALVRLGEEEYRNEIEILLENIKDEEIKTEARRCLGE